MEWRGPSGPTAIFPYGGEPIGKLFGACFDAFSHMSSDSKLQHSDSERREKLISRRCTLLPPPLPDALPSRLLTRLAAPCARP